MAQDSLFEFVRVEPGPPREGCPCGCHDGEAGFFHCFGVCCESPDVPREELAKDLNSDEP